MKALIASLALFCLVASPARAHHEPNYGIFWKAGAHAPDSKRLPNDLWRYAFVSRYAWH